MQSGSSSKAPLGSGVRRTIRPDSIQSLLEQHPWLTEDDVRSFATKSRKRARTSAPQVDAAPDEPDLMSDEKQEESAPVEDSQPEAPAEDEDIFEMAGLQVHNEGDAFQELAEVRAEWSWDAQDDMHFYTRILGGA